MNEIIRKFQFKILNIFSQCSKTFALSGGTALDIFYLHHRFSKDLDFFSPHYDLAEIDYLVNRFKKVTKRICLEDELLSSDKARVRFYIAKIEGMDLELKIDFIEDVFFKKPKIKRFNNIPVYDVKHIYFQKIVSLVGTNLKLDITGREVTTGRKESRDVVDIYYLSKKILPLHKFLKTIDNVYKRGMVQWYRSYSRQELKLEVLDLDIYDKDFDTSKMIKYLDEEIEKFVEETIW